MLRSTHRNIVANFAFALGYRMRRSAVSLSLSAIALGLAAGGLSLAADTAGGAKGGRDASAPTGTAPAATGAARPDDAERKKVINSPEWRAMQHDLMEWLSVQKVYTPSQLRKVKAELNAKVARMSPQELVEFMQDMEVKLKILMSPEAEEARLWVERTLAVRANLTPEQLKRMRPDVLNMTSAQLEQRLMEWQDQRKRTIAAQQAFDKGKATQIKNIEAMEKDEERERDEALNRAYFEQGNGSPYGSYYGGRAVNNPGGGGYFGGGYIGGGYGGGGYYGGYRW